MTKLPARGPMPSMLLALLSLGIMPKPSLLAAMSCCNDGSKRRFGAGRTAPNCLLKLRSTQYDDSGVSHVQWDWKQFADY